MIEALKSKISPEDLASFEEKCKSYVFFFTSALDELRKGYKNNYTLILAMAKIDAIIFPE